MVTLRPRKRKMARGLQLDEKTTPIHQMRILKLRKEEEWPRKLQAIKRKAKNIYRFCCALFALRARKHRVNQAHFAPRRCKAKEYIDFFFQIALRASSFFWPIPVIEDKAKQALAKMALETEWVAYFEPNSYGFRLGQNSQDATIKAIFLAIRAKPKYVLNADISKCFNCINHEALLNKLKTLPSLAKQVKKPGLKPTSWLNWEIILSTWKS